MHVNSKNTSVRGPTDGEACSGAMTSAPVSSHPTPSSTPSQRRLVADDTPSCESFTSSCELRLSKTIPRVASIATVAESDAPRTNDAAMLPALVATAMLVDRAIDPAVETSADLIVLPRSQHTQQLHERRYSNVNESTELVLEHHQTPDATPQSQRLRIFPLSASAVAGLYSDRYAFATCDSAAFSPHSTSSCTRSTHNTAQTASLDEEAAATLTCSIGVEEVPVFYEAHSPRKRMRSDADVLGNHQQESPSSRYRLGVSSQQSLADVGQFPLPDGGRSSPSNRSSSMTGGRAETPLFGSKQSCTPHVTMSSEASLCLTSLHQHRTLHHHSQSKSNAAEDSRDPLSVLAGTPQRGNTPQLGERPPLCTSGVHASMSPRWQRISSGDAATSSMAGEATATPTCVDSAQLVLSRPGKTASISRPIKRVAQDYSPQVERSLDTSSIDITRMPIPGDMRINILGRGASDFDAEDDEDMDEEARDHILEEQAKRMYGRILTAHKKASHPDTVGDADTEHGLTVHTTTASKPNASPRDQQPGKSQEPTEVVARSPSAPHTPANASPRIVRFQVPDCSASLSQTDGLRDTAAALQDPTISTVRVNSPYTAKRHVAFKIDASPSPLQSGIGLDSPATAPKVRLHSPKPPIAHDTTSEEEEQLQVAGTCSVACPLSERYAHDVHVHKKTDAAALVSAENADASCLPASQSVAVHSREPPPGGPAVIAGHNAPTHPSAPDNDTLSHDKVDTTAPRTPHTAKAPRPPRPKDALRSLSPLHSEELHPALRQNGIAITGVLWRGTGSPTPKRTPKTRSDEAQTADLPRLGMGSAPKQVHLPQRPREHCPSTSSIVVADGSGVLPSLGLGRSGNNTEKRSSF